MPTDRIDMQKMQASLDTSLHAHWAFFLVEGLILLALGVIAIVVPPIATIAVEVVIGWRVLVSGIIGLATTIKARGAPGFGWSLISAVLGIVVGVVLLAWPLSGALTLTMILTAFLFIEGIVSILYALDHRRDLTPRWSFMLVSGVVDILLAGMIFAGLPATAAWAIGLLVGINLLFGGVALIAMALQARTPVSRANP